MNADVGTNLGQCRKVSADKRIDLSKDRKIQNIALGKSDDKILIKHTHYYLRIQAK